MNQRVAKPQRIDGLFLSDGDICCSGDLCFNLDTYACTHRYCMQPVQDPIELNPDRVHFIEALRIPETGQIQAYDPQLPPHTSTTQSTCVPTLTMVE